MQITVHKDPVTGLITHTYVEDTPVELSPEEKEKDEKFWEDMFDSNRKYNQRKKNLHENFWKLNSKNFQEVFNTLFEDYKTTAKVENNEDKEENLNREFKKSFIEAFVDSLREEKNIKKLKKNLPKVLQLWEVVINPQILTVILWQMDFKEQSLKLLENNPCEVKADLYDYMYDFVKEFRKNKLPLNSVERDNILNEEKNNFLHIQNKYNTFKKINDKLVEKNIKTKHKKI